MSLNPSRNTPRIYVDSIPSNRSSSHGTNMIQLITVFVKQAYKNVDVDSFIRKNKENEPEDFASELLVLYTALNGIYIAGLNILQELDRIQKQALRYLNEKREMQLIMTHDLAEGLNREAARLKTFAESIQRLIDITNIRSQEKSRKMSFFLDGKVNFVNYISMILTSNNVNRYSGLAFSRTTERNFLQVLEDFQKSGLRNTYRIQDRGSQSFAARVSESLDQAEKLNKYSEFSIQEVKILKDYVEGNNLDSYLDEQKLILHKLYCVLVRNFKVLDIVLKAGDARGESREFFM
jgi:hypothetical protein